MHAHMIYIYIYIYKNIYTHIEIDVDVKNVPSNLPCVFTSAKDAREIAHLDSLF